jgi:hypothetical protein
MKALLYFLAPLILITACATGPAHSGPKGGDVAILSSGSGPGTDLVIYSDKLLTIIEAIDGKRVGGLGPALNKPKVTAGTHTVLLHAKGQNSHRVLHAVAEITFQAAAGHRYHMVCEAKEEKEAVFTLYDMTDGKKTVIQTKRVPTKSPRIVYM